MKISNLSLVTTILFILAASCSSNPTDFVRRSCKMTQYPDDCYKSLVTYASTVRRSPRQLAFAALNVSVERVRSVSTYVARMSARPKPTTFTESEQPSEDGPFQDCTENLNDSLDLLRQSIHELGHMGRAKSTRFRFHLSNVQTKVSAALTGETTCLDSVVLLSSGPQVNNVMIHSKVVQAARATSNALALVSRL